MKYLIALLIIPTLFQLSCTNISNTSSQPDLKLSSHAPYLLTISNFTWGYGRIEINKFSGDFESLDQKVFELLKDKSSTCRVMLNSTLKDKYGNEADHMTFIGNIDLAELSKYKDWTYWHADGGIKRMIYDELIDRKVPTHPVDTTPMIDSTVVQ